MTQPPRWLRALWTLDPESAHRLSIEGLSLAQAFPWVLAGLTRRFGRTSRRLQTRLAGMALANPLGLAAGYDKNAEVVQACLALGFGFAEVGAVTPFPQDGNELPRLFRYPLDQALVNRMGFNNAGSHHVASQLFHAQPRRGPVGLNLGKNRWTSLDDAHRDMVAVAAVAGAAADFWTINVSSPNTPGLRSLQSSGPLQKLLRAVRAVDVHKPLFLKLSPDLDEASLRAAAEAALAERLDGLIATNTTLSRPPGRDADFESGGLSGAPLKELALSRVRFLFRHTRGQFPIVGAGGILSGSDALEFIEAGSTAVQIYSGLVFRGPGLIPEILEAVDQRVTSLGLTSVADLVGRENA